MASVGTFVLFPDLPIEIRLKVWEYAFAPRVVNIIYDELEDRYHTFNSTVPTLLHIHHESRMLGLRTLKLRFGTESHEPRIYFDFSRDILLFDDYLDLGVAYSQIGTSSYSAFLQAKELLVECQEIKRLAFNSSYFQSFVDPDHETAAFRKVVEPLLAKFHALEDIFIVVEGANPFCTSKIQFFDINEDHSCSPICDVCYAKHLSLPAVDDLRKVYGQKPQIRIVGAYRGGSRLDLGCYDKEVEQDPADDPIDIDAPGSPHAVSECDHSTILFADPPFYDDPVFSYDSDDGEVEKSFNEYLKGDLFQQYEYADVEETFSEFESEEVEDPSSIPPEELQDIVADEKRYLEKCSGAPYKTFQDEWVDPEYYERRMEL
jgi:hypothetical protein